VQVNVEGNWVAGEIIAESGMEYQVQLPNNRAAWASAQHLRRVAVAETPVPTPGTPPKPGLQSCAGKIEGRYAHPNTGSQITIRGGKAKLTGLGAGEEYECWMDAKTIYLHEPGKPADDDMPIDINDDGTLQTAIGEMKKKGD
jgi:hypothetical protein